MKKKAGKPEKIITLNRSGRDTRLTLSEALGLINQLATEKHYSTVIQATHQILDQAPGNSDARLALYRALAATAQFQQLEECCQLHLDSRPRDLLSLEYRAHALRELGRDREALPLLEKAVELAKTNVRLINALGTAYKEAGFLDKAMDQFQRATAIKPQMGKAYWNRSDLPNDPAVEIKNLERNLKQLARNSAQRPYFYFSLYRAYEKAGEYDKAFDYLKLGNTAKRQLLDPDIQGELTNDDRIRTFFQKEYHGLKKRISESDSDFSDFPAIFIVGMPRSGTSLVEQIIGSHPQVSGGGEIPLLTKATETLFHRLRLSSPFPDCLLQLTAGDFARIGHIYRQLAAPYLNDKRSLTDKFLLNYKAVPLISLALPRAKIIHVRRDPTDTCFGCYRQLFNSGLEFCYDLDDLANTWLSYDKTMSLWQELLPLDYYTCEYESLVMEPERNTRALLDYCELPWEAACMKFYDTERTVKTASNLQVRKPLFKTGIGRWKRYESALTQFNNTILSGLAGNRDSRQPNLPR